MTAPNRSTLWGELLVEELIAGGLDAVCIAPGSRSTPLTLAFDAHPGVEVYSHLDERSAAYFALGRSRRTGEPTALVCTSGTAVANFHPAVVEADQGRVPMLVLTADRPPELRDSGANQTIDQRNIYGSAVRWSVDLPEPAPVERTVRSLRTTAARALAKTKTPPAGPVHLNCPFAKPLEPTMDGADGERTDSIDADPSTATDPVPGASSVPADFADTPAGRGRDGPFVSTTVGRPVADDEEVTDLATALGSADRPLFVIGPLDPTTLADDGNWQARLVELAERLGAPVLADPLSDLRYGPAARSSIVCSAYDAYVEALAFDPDVVVRLGDAPTSKALAHALLDADATQYIVDPAGSWRESTFTATNLIVTDPVWLVSRLVDTLVDETEPTAARGDWVGRFLGAESIAERVLEEAIEPETFAVKPFEGAILSTVLGTAPDPSTVFVSNSMPIRDADRFGRSRDAKLTVLANRGASGIDGIVSTALGAGSVDDDPLTLVTGDLACYHDSNGLLAIDRCGVDVTIVVIHNDGGGIFHALPIEDHEPPFTEQFKTPHGLDFAPLAELYGLSYESVEPAGFERAYRRAIDEPGSHLVAVRFDAESSHRRREWLADQVAERL